MQRYELEGFVEEIKGTCATSLKVINNYMIRGDYCKYVVFDTIVETIDGRKITRKEPRVVELPCINLKEVERAANIVKKLSKVVETSVKSIDPEKQEWKKKSPWQQYSEEYPEQVKPSYIEIDESLPSDGSPIIETSDISEEAMAELEAFLQEAKEVLG